MARRGSVLCVSETWTREMRDTYGIDAATVPNGVDLERYSKQRRLTIKYCGSGLALLARTGRARSRWHRSAQEHARRARCIRANCANIIRMRSLVIAGGASLLDHDAYAHAFMDRVR